MFSLDQIRAHLKPHRPRLEQLGVKNLWVFGSVARGDPTAKDLDVLVEFSRPPGLMDFMDTKFLMEELFCMEVDLHSLGACPTHFFSRIRNELKHVA